MERNHLQMHAEEVITPPDRSLQELMSQGAVKHVFQLGRYPKYYTGQYYWCGYWKYIFKVLKVDIDHSHKPAHMKSVTVLCDNGKTVTHCTSLDNTSDYLLEVNEDLFNQHVTEQNALESSKATLKNMDMFPDTK